LPLWGIHSIITLIRIKIRTGWENVRLVHGKEAAETDLSGYCRFIRPDNKSGGRTNEEK